MLLHDYPGFGTCFCKVSADCSQILFGEAFTGIIQDPKQLKAANLPSGSCWGASGAVQPDRVVVTSTGGLIVLVEESDGSGEVVAGRIYRVDPLDGSIIVASTGVRTPEGKADTFWKGVTQARAVIARLGLRCALS